MADIIARALALQGIRIAPSNNFSSTTERDQYFQNNPSELKPGMYIFCAGQLQTYNGSEWKDATPAVSGPEGFSPSIAVNTDTEEEYTLTIINKDNTFVTPNLKGSGSGGGGISTYTNLNPTTMEVGGIPVGTTFDHTPIEDVITMLLYGAQNPTFELPFATLALDLEYLQEIGTVINPTLTATFDRGAITPQYSASEPYRAGLPSQYIFTGPKANFITSKDLEVSQTLTYTVTEGETTWAMFVEYSKGPQPYNSVGAPYDAPFPAGTTDTHTVKIKGVYPLYAPINNISTYEKLPLQDTTTTEYLISLPAESTTEKQRVLIPQTVPEIYGIQFYNTILQQWEWLMGSPEQSLTTFSKTATTINGVRYWEYTNLSAQIGARELKFMASASSNYSLRKPQTEAEIEAEEIKEQILQKIKEVEA